MITNCHGLLYHCQVLSKILATIASSLFLGIVRKYEEVKYNSDIFGVILLPFIAWGTRVHAPIG